MEFGNEIGYTLDRTLRLFPNKNLCVEDLIQKYKVSEEIAREMIFALVRRGYIVSSYSKKYLHPEDVDIAEFFRITIEGRDYLELHRVFWQRFWFRSIGCPVIVSFITTILAKPVWNRITETATWLYEVTRGLTTAEKNLQQFIKLLQKFKGGELRYRKFLC